MPSSIVLTNDPRGRFVEGIISGTPKPGTVVQVKAATEPQHGKLTWEVYNKAADGSRALIAVLVEAWWLGRTVDDAYKDGEHCQIYFPLPGDELLMLLQNQAGTADSFNIGDELMVDNGTGLLIAVSGTPESKPFIVIETVPALTADTLAKVMFTGY
ncbi:MAG: hypothetical protein KatS3mg087_1199 [Patescibacteria group bacterium]|nr:MAG: hypothetical protein KatS3mg087_1199 [Patescibacteria group bacterium]